MGYLNAMDSKITREHVIAEIRRIADACGGAPPGMKTFHAKTGIKEHQIRGVLWATWSEALQEAGYTPNSLTAAIPADDLLAYAANLARDLGRIPSKEHIKLASRQNVGFPSVTTFYKRFGNQPGLIAAMKEWVEGKKEFQEVASLLSTHKSKGKPSPSEASPSPISDIAQLSESFIPPVIASLPFLARATPSVLAQCEARGCDENVEFEKRVAVAFEILGFSVTRLGQGSGRVADGIAECHDGRWAIIYDAKVRRDGFRMGIEDRKFKEYIERHGEQLRQKGILKAYFAVISSSFFESDIPKARELMRLPLAKSCVLMEAEALVTLVEARVRNPSQLRPDDIERAFLRTRIVTAGNIFENR
jgi:hypothetical protein